MPRRRGGQYKPVVPGQRAALGLRVISQTKQKIDDRARQNGRTQSQQAEVFIEWAIDHQERLGGERVCVLLEAMATMAREEFGPDWLRNPNNFRGVSRLWTEVLRAVQPWQNLSEELVTTANWALDDFEQSADPIYVRIARQCIDHSYEKGDVRPELAPYRDGIRDIIGSLEAATAEFTEKAGTSDLAGALRSYASRHPHDPDDPVLKLVPQADSVLERMTLELKLMERHRESSNPPADKAASPDVSRPWVMQLDHRLNDVVNRLDQLTALVQDSIAKPTNDRGDRLGRDHPEFEGGRQFAAAWGLARLMILQSDPSHEPSDREIATQLSHTGDLLYLCGMYKFGPHNADSVLAYRARLQAEQADAAPRPTRVEDKAGGADVPVWGSDDISAEQTGRHERRP